MTGPDENGKRGYSWAPFTKGHKRGVIHGARDEARVQELAGQYAANLLADPAMPAYLSEPSFRGAVDAYARTAVIVDLLWSWLNSQDIADALADVTTTSEEEDRVYEPGDDASTGARTPRSRRTRRRSESDHVASVLRQLDRHEGTLALQRGRLGLDPYSRAKLGRSVTRPSAALAEALEELGRQMGAEP